MGSKQTQAGFTLVELMIVIALMVLFATMVVPSYTYIVSKRNLTEAKENTMMAFAKAKNTARTRNTNVVIEISHLSNKLILRLPDDRVLSTIALPDSVLPTTDAVFKFSSIGTVDKTGTITLVYRNSDKYRQSLTVSNLLGKVVAG